ncbi:MAG: hypothetical protein V4718_05005 [Pseudomonadota bacterium]
MKNVSNWRAVRVLEGRLERELRQRHSLRLHGFFIGFATLLLMWLVSHVQMLLGGESLALRYFATLGTGYVAYLLLLRVWAAWLVNHGRGDAWDFPDVTNGIDIMPRGGGSMQMPDMQSGMGGDFGGGGATGDFSGGSDAASGLGDVASGALEVAGASDEGAVVVIPVVAIFLIGTALLFGAGSLLLLFFGWEVLLTVAVELAFTYVTARATIRVVREGWVSAAVRLTWKPLLGAVACAVALGATIDHFIPAANSLPQALKLIKAQSERK